MITISSSMLVTYHPLNEVYYFSKLMIKLKNNIRDMYLKDFLYIDIIRTRINSISKIPYYADLSKFNYNLKQNFVQLFFWFLSVSDREIRDKSTKALTAFLVSDLTLIDELIDIISNVNDQYIIERFICCVHSAHVLNNDNVLLKKHYHKIEKIFCSKQISNIRIRHYLMLLNHLCYDKKIINDKKTFDNICSKPNLKIEYNSKRDLYKLLNKTGIIGIATIQSPFNSDSTYFYIREDLYKEIIRQFNIIVGVYSEKEFETNDPKAFSKYAICCAIDGAYEYKENDLKKIAVYKRDEDTIA